MDAQDWFTESFANTAVEEPPAAESVIETAAPGVETAPPLATTESIPDSTLNPAPSAAPAVPETPVQWESPDNPLYEDAMLARQIRQHAVEANRLKQQTDFQNKLTEYADGDSQRLQELTGLMAQQTAPLYQQAHAFQQRADASDKQLAAFFIAAKASLTDEQIQSLIGETNELMTLDGADVMERTAFGKRDSRRQYESTLSAKDAEILALRQQLSSQGRLASREATGADLVDGGTGVPSDMSLQDQLRAAPDMDSFMELQFGARRAS